MSAMPHGLQAAPQTPRTSLAFISDLECNSPASTVLDSSPGSLFSVSPYITHDAVKKEEPQSSQPDAIFDNEEGGRCHSALGFNSKKRQVHWTLERQQKNVKQEAENAVTPVKLEEPKTEKLEEPKTEKLEEPKTETLSYQEETPLEKMIEEKLEEMKNEKFEEQFSPW